MWPPVDACLLLGHITSLMKPEPGQLMNSALTCLWVTAPGLELWSARVQELVSGLRAKWKVLFPMTASVLLSMGETGQCSLVLSSHSFLHGWPLFGGGYAFRSQRQVPTARVFSSSSHSQFSPTWTGACFRQLDHGPSFETALLVFVRMAAVPWVVLVAGESSQGLEPLGSRVVTSVFPAHVRQGRLGLAFRPPNLKPSLSVLPGPIFRSECCCLDRVLLFKWARK